MTVNGWIQILIYCAIVRRAGEAARLVHDARLHRRAHVPLAGPASGRARALSASAASTRSASSIGSTYTVAMLLFHVGGFLILYLLLRLQGGLPFNPAGMGAVPEALSFNTAVSFITNTNWQNYGGESTLSYLTQMLGLTPPELPVGGDRHRARGGADPRLRPRIGAHGRQFLGRYHPLHPLHPPADLHALRPLPRLAGHAADARRLCRRDDAGRRQADDRASARSPRRSPSRCSAPMAAASSTPTPRIRSRTRPRSRTSSR